MDNFKNGMAEKAIRGALIGWAIFFLAYSMIIRFPETEAEWKIAIFLSMAPGVVVGILIAYVSSKKKDDNASSNNITQTSVSNVSEVKPEKSVTEQLLELKNLKDSGIVSEEEFKTLKHKLLNDELNSKKN